MCSVYVHLILLSECYNVNVHCYNPDKFFGMLIRNEIWIKSHTMYLYRYFTVGACRSIILPLLLGGPFGTPGGGGWSHCGQWQSQEHLDPAVKVLAPYSLQLQFCSFTQKYVSFFEIKMPYITTSNYYTLSKHNTYPPVPYSQCTRKYHLILDTIHSTILLTLQYLSLRQYEVLFCRPHLLRRLSLCGSHPSACNHKLTIPHRGQTASVGSVSTLTHPHILPEELYMQ